MNDIEYRTNTTIEAIIARLRAARKVLITSHEKPDGDAVGSCAAIARALGAIGVDSDVWLLGAVSQSLLSLVSDLSPRRSPEETPGDEYDLVVVLDTGAWSQLEPLEDYLRGRAESVITIDHHERGDAVGSERIVMTGTASCTQVIVPIIDALGVDLSVGGDDDGCFSIAEAILLGLATDTGWFRFESCGPDSMRLAARLLDAGANKNRLIRIIEESDRPQRIEMTARALTSAQFANDDRSVVMCLSARDFEETGARPEELSGLVNSPMSVGSVEVSALLTEVEVGMVKMSFRSKPAISGSGRGFIDVNALAGRFNGGGHVHAAGARLVATLEEARTRVEEAIESALQDAGFAASGSTV